MDTPRGGCSYAQLRDRARAGAAELAARGATPGERVAIALPAGPELAYALHACLLLGAVAVPVDLRLGERERRAIADGAAVVVDEPLHADTARGLLAKPKRSLPTDPEGSPPARPRGGLPVKPVHDLDAVAAVIHTSGTTSAPKPVELTFGNFLWSALGSAVALGLDPQERWLCNLPLSHVGGLSILLRSAIYGTTAVIHERFDTELTLAALAAPAGSRGSATLVSLVATTLARLLDAGLERPPALRCALTGGGPVPSALVARARAAGIPVSLTYGLTEACSQVTTLPPSAAQDVTPTAGPPLFCTRVRVAPEGEIEVAGPTLARGVAGPDGWLRTGDLGRLNGEGSLEVTGRKSDTIVSGGENVAPAEVEAVLEEHPEVLEAAVVGRADERWGEAVTALVVTRAGTAVDERELREHCAGRLAPYKVPKRVVTIAGPLPRTGSGKLLRRELT